MNNTQKTSSFQRTMASPVVKRLRTLEQSRTARFRLARQRTVQTLRHADEAAKSMLLQDLTDVAVAVVEALQLAKEEHQVQEVQEESEN